MADRIIKPDSGNSLVLQDEGGTAALTIDTSGNAEFHVSVKTDIISEKTASTGVTIDGTLIKDNSFKPASGQALILYEEGGAEALKIDDGGAIIFGGSISVNYLFGTTNNSPGEGTTSGVRIGGNGGCQFSMDNSTPITVNRYNNIGTSIVFNYAGSTKGNISVSTTAIAFNETSDYRLKENVTPLTNAIDRVNQLKPSRFNFIIEPNKTFDGFLAHEVSDYIPEAVTGEKDAVDENGEILPQGIDKSKMIPLLVASVQELSAKVTALEKA